MALDFALARLTGVVDKLVVYPERMQANFDALGGLHNSQRVLLALTQAGMSREDAYRAVQRHAMTVWQDGRRLRRGAQGGCRYRGPSDGGGNRRAFRPGLLHKPGRGRFFERRVRRVNCVGCAADCATRVRPLHYAAAFIARTYPAAA